MTHAAFDAGSSRIVIPEALAVTTYSNIIDNAPLFQRLASDDQGYLRAARQEEMSHYLLEQSLTGSPSPFTTFYYPAGMFANAQMTLNILVTLEDAFIAAYLVGVRNFSKQLLRVASARIMGIESDHRTLARVVAPGVASVDGGPIETVTGIQGVAESVDPPKTTTATSAHWAGRRSTRLSMPCYRSPARRQPPRRASIRLKRTTFIPLRPRCPVRWAPSRSRNS